MPSDNFFFSLFKKRLHTTKLTVSDKIKMAAKIRGVLIDLSGTIHIENTVIPGSIQALKRYFISKIYDGSFFVFKCVILQVRIRISDISCYAQGKAMPCVETFRNLRTSRWQSLESFDKIMKPVFLSSCSGVLPSLFLAKCVYFLSIREIRQ